MNKLIINQDVLLRTPITEVRRHIDDKKKVKLSLFQAVEAHRVARG
jgi:hypothetical protein